MSEQWTQVFTEEFHLECNFTTTDKPLHHSITVSIYCATEFKGEKSL